MCTENVKKKTMTHKNDSVFFICKQKINLRYLYYYYRDIYTNIKRYLY